MSSLRNVSACADPGMFVREGGGPGPTARKQP